MLHIAARHAASIASSSAPPRSRRRRSVSSVENRQLRIWPSAVSRVRSHVEQKACDTEAMTPNRPRGVFGPASTSQSSAGAEPRGAGSGRSRKWGRSAASTSSALSAMFRRQLCPASSGICSMTRN
ncbi:Uncharacterised protein [Mycobacterium tuberculosis]|nr:Uncharacterised protein [Mycobacterium tuberculosis]